MYNIPLEQCDVLEKDKLEVYRAKRTEWLDHLYGDDDHSICNQLVSMSWSYITFRVINEARRLAHRFNLQSAIRNDVLFEHLTDGFVASQSLAIRKLTDVGRRNTSLKRLLNHIDKHGALFTREIFVGYDGIPVEIAMAQKEHERRLREAAKELRPVWCPVDLRDSERRHAAFDRLFGRAPTPTDRTDRVPKCVLRRLKALLDADALTRIKSFADKRIAHAANRSSREPEIVGIDGIRFRDIEEAHRLLITVGNFISQELLYAGPLLAVPTPQFDVFEHIDAAGFNSKLLDRLDRLKNVLAGRRDRWQRQAVDEILASR